MLSVSRRIEAAQRGKTVHSRSVGGKDANRQHSVVQVASQERARRRPAAVPTRTISCASSCSRTYPRSPSGTQERSRARKTLSRSLLIPGEAEEVGNYLPVCGPVAVSSSSSRFAVVSGGLPGYITQASRDLPEQPAHWMPVLADQQHLAGLIDRDDGDRARILDVARPPRPPGHPAMRHRILAQLDNIAGGKVLASDYGPALRTRHGARRLLAHALATERPPATALTACPALRPDPRPRRRDKPR